MTRRGFDKDGQENAYLIYKEGAATYKKEGKAARRAATNRRERRAATMKEEAKVRNIDRGLKHLFAESPLWKKNGS